ncbi:MAG: peptidoglycan DD-metalloendopeptidase family protein [Oleispira antarctica]|nr:peptidoglycan DD-metalloendopeptidase family protein [Oleispira antarctica]MBQ0792318.1 peptidoglycan DD-metalloendopeptidase family protein [Oleispira antarctica]
MAVLGQWRYFPKTHIAAISLLTIFVIFAIGKNTNVPQKREVQTLIVNSATLDTQLEEIEVWEQTELKAGDNLSRVFTRYSLSAADALAIASSAPKRVLNLQPGQIIKWQSSESNNVTRMRIETSPLIAHVFERAIDGDYEYKLDEKVADRRPKFAHATINSSLFLDGAKQDIPQSTLIELAGLFGWDIDFALDIRPGDEFSLIYEELYLDGERIGFGNILIANFVNRGREITAIRYEDGKGDAQYYDPSGHSMRKEFLRNPIDFARISSRFNLKRKHPVLNKFRAHRGTDYAARTGTPIKSTGDGKVIFAGRKGGFGNCVIVQHGSRYQTLYAHMSKFNRSARKGRRVKQGQVIGYVGSTGLATGPHLHFEFRVDGVHRDSLRIKLPKSRSIGKDQKELYKAKSERMIEWLKSQRDTQLASDDSLSLAKISEQ